MRSGLPVQRHDARSLPRIIGSDFELLETRPHRHITPTGAAQSFQFSVFRRRGAE